MMMTMMDIFSFSLSLTVKEHSRLLSLVTRSHWLFGLFLNNWDFSAVLLLSLFIYNTRRPPARIALSIISRYVK
jgi:hypothetical protein